MRISATWPNQQTKASSRHGLKIYGFGICHLLHNNFRRTTICLKAITSSLFIESCCCCGCGCSAEQPVVAVVNEYIWRFHKLSSLYCMYFIYCLKCTNSELEAVSNFSFKFMCKPQFDNVLAIVILWSIIIMLISSLFLNSHTEGDSPDISCTSQILCQGGLSYWELTELYKLCK